MQLTEFIAANSLGGTDIHSLEKALKNKKVVSTQGHITFKDDSGEGHTLQCVMEHFTEREDRKVTQCTRKADPDYRRCYSVRLAFGIDDINKSCASCYEHCIERFKEGTLFRVDASQGTGRRRRRR